MIIKNPVLKGFNPDPSSCKLNDIIYIAVSTFQWVPGIRIYQTKDLINYEYVTDVLTNIDMRGNPDDCGIWAPQLSYVDNTFYLLYTNVRSTKRPFKDTPNYLITSKDIKGPWSKPIYLNSSGFDPSFYHEDDKSYLLNCIWDYRLETPNKSDGIIIQEYDRKKKKLIGKSYKIFSGTEARKTEAPHIYKINNYYFLITAEGGTGEDHQVTVLRSKNIYGPYELDPNNPLLTSKNNKELLLHCSGHGSIINYDNNLYMYHLCTRPYYGKAILGRETAIQKLIYTKDNWLKLDNINNEPLEEININNKDLIKNEDNLNFTDNFENNNLNYNWNYLRYNSSKKWLKFLNPGIKIYGGQSLNSLFDVNLIGIRINSFKFKAEVDIKFNPHSFNEMAGISIYLNSDKYIKLYITYDEKLKKCVRLFSKVNDENILYEEKYKLNNKTNHLEIELIDKFLSFKVDNILFNTKFDITKLSGGFTGNYIGLFGCDLNYNLKTYANFYNFKYNAKEK